MEDLKCWTLNYQRESESDSASSVCTLLTLVESLHDEQYQF